MRTGTLLAIVAFLVILVPSAHATSRTDAQRAARRSANAWTNHHYGIGFSTPGGWRMWSARCGRAGGGWACTVRMNGGQCVGTLRLTAGLHDYAHRIGCGE